jgi:alpha-glucosidase (family GH31 glycosyl hydrolase)
VLDTYAHATFDLCKANPLEASVEAWEKELRFHVFDGPSPLEALSRMTTFVGRPWMPPPWMFAPWNDAILGPENVLKFARFLRDNQIPTSAIWSEDFRGGIWQPYGYRIAPNWRPDRTLYPEPEKLVADLRALGITWQLYFNPHVIEKADVATDARDKRVLLHKKSGEPFQWAGADGTFGLTAMLDLTNPASRDWAKGLLKEAIALGSLGWMADFGEWMPIDDAMVASGEDPMLVHNRYPLLWQEVNRDAMKEAGALDRMCVYHRSGHLRSQGTTLIMWAGDQRTSFEKDDGLPTIIPIGLGLAATGFPFYAHDIAGYQFLGNKPPEAASKELFYRWTELGAFTPVMRTHHGIKVKDNWTLDKDAETTAMWRRYAQLHTQLYPYWRGLAVRAVKEGRPLWIPMGFLHPDDEDAWAVRDQFYLGDALLVAPVVEEGASGRRVVFPRGRFAPLLEPGAAMFGPAKEYVSAPLDKIPVYLAAGGIVPTTKEIPMTLFEGVEGVPGLEVTRGDRVVYVGLGADGTFVEENGARYTLRGTRSEVPKEEVILTGNGRYQGDGFVLELEGHPPDRKTQLVFR